MKLRLASDLQVNRRTALRALASSTITLSAATVAQAVPYIRPRRTGMGLVIYDFSIRRRQMREKRPEFDLFEPFTFLQHCHALGTGGMQASLGVMSTEKIGRLREFAKANNLFIDAIVRPPKNKADLPRFEAEIQTARDVGVQAARTTIIPGRRYERFKSLAEFREFETLGRQMLERAAPIVEKHRVRLAVENHKDQRIDERVALFRRLDHEFIGACVDTGNSFALLDGAYEPIEALAPYAFSVHLKDQALSPHPDGFLLGDIPLGQGSFDLKRMVDIIRKAKPKVQFSLELITRDPLRVPCLTQGYFATMPASRAADLARSLRFVQQHPAKALQQVSALSIDKRVKLEEANVESSIKFASEVLRL